MYPSLLGRVSPIGLRDSLLDYAQGKYTPENRAIWQVNGAIESVTDLAALDLSQLQGDAERYRWSMVLAIEHLLPLCQQFYPDQAAQVFESITDTIQAGYQHARSLLLWQVVAWLSVDGWRWPRDGALAYGLVAEYPEPVLHFCYCLAGFEREFYESLVPPSRRVALWGRLQPPPAKPVPWWRRWRWWR